MIKAIFFDIDGTLLSHASGGVPESARTALRLLRQRGVKLFLATGRHILEIHRLPVGRLPFDGYVTLNGQICLDEREALLFDAPFGPADAQRMVSLFRQKASPAMLVERDRLYINYVDEAVRLAQEAIETPIPQLGDYAGGSLYQFIVYGGEDRAAALLEQLPGCKMSRWNACAVDILPKSGGKALGIQRLLDHFRLESHEVMAFGDGECRDPGPGGGGLCDGGHRPGRRLPCAVSLRLNRKQPAFSGQMRGGGIASAMPPLWRVNRG